MRKFLLKIIFFVSLPLLVILIHEVLISVYRSSLLSEVSMDKAYSAVGSEYKWIEKIKSKNKIILAGSSSVKYDLSCTVLNRLAHDTLFFANIADDARDPIETYFILKQINLKDVKAVYFGLDPFIYAKSFYVNRNPYLYFDLDMVNVSKYCVEYDKVIFMKRVVEFYKHQMPTSKHTPENLIIPDDFGSQKLTANLPDFNGDKVDEWFQTDKYGWSYLQFQYLMKISELCKRQNIGFYTFLPPKRDDFCKTYQLKCKTIHEEYIHNLDSVGFDATIFGKFDDLGAIDNRVLFQDAFHLNGKGQLIYSGLFFKQMQATEKERFSLLYKWF